MKSFLNYAHETSGSIRGFELTNEYIVSAGRRVVVHSLQCQQCKKHHSDLDLNASELCSNHQASFDVGEIWSAKIHPESNLLLTGSHKLKMDLWNLQNGTHIREFLGHTGEIDHVAFLDADATRFVSGSNDMTIRLWTLTDEGSTRILRGHTGAIARLGIHKSYLISGSFDKTVRIWDPSTGDCIHILEDHSSYVSVIHFSPDDDSLLYAGCGDGEFRIWNWTKGQLVAVCQANTKVPSQYLEMDKLLATCGQDGKVRTWTQTGSLVKTLNAHDAPVRALVKFGDFVVTGGMDGRLKLWDWENEKWLFDLQDPLKVVSNFVVRGGKLAVAYWMGDESFRIQVWDLEDIRTFVLEQARGRNEIEENLSMPEG